MAYGLPQPVEEEVFQTLQRQGPACTGLQLQVEGYDCSVRTI